MAVSLAAAVDRLRRTLLAVGLLPALLACVSTQAESPREAYAASVLQVPSTPVSARQDEPTKKEQFDLLSTSLANLSDEYTADMIGTISFLLLVLGWFIMSERSREYLHTNRLARRAALTAIPSVALMNALLVSGVYTASRAKVRALERLDYLGSDYYGDDEITLTLLIANLAIHLVLFGTVFVLVWARKAHTPSPAPGAAE